MKIEEFHSSFHRFFILWITMIQFRMKIFFLYQYYMNFLARWFIHSLKALLAGSRARWWIKRAALNIYISRRSLLVLTPQAKGAATKLNMVLRLNWGTIKDGQPIESHGRERLKSSTDSSAESNVNVNVTRRSFPFICIKLKNIIFIYSNLPFFLSFQF